MQQQIYNENSATLAPFVNAGTAVTPLIQGALGMGDRAATDAAFNTFKDSSGYNIRLAEGAKQVTAALGSRGLLDSGAAQKSLLKYGQGFASNEFGNWLGALQGQQQIGLGAASAKAGVGQNFANATNANNTNAGNASMNATMQGAAALNGTLNNLVGAYAFSQGGGFGGSSYGSGANSYGIYNGGNGIY